MSHKTPLKVSKLLSNYYDSNNCFSSEARAGRVTSHIGAKRASSSTMEQAIKRAKTMNSCTVADLHTYSNVFRLLHNAMISRAPGAKPGWDGGDGGAGRCLAVGV